MSTTFVDLLTEIGDENLNYQVIHQCMTGITKKKGGASEVKFLTDAITPNEVLSNNGKIGIIVWVDREDYREAANNLKENQK